MVALVIGCSRVQTAERSDSLRIKKRIAITATNALGMLKRAEVFTAIKKQRIYAFSLEPLADPQRVLRNATLYLAREYPHAKEPLHVEHRNERQAIRILEALLTVIALTR